MTLPMRRPNRRQRGRSIQAAGRQMPTDVGRFRTEEPSNAGGFTWQTRAWHVVKNLGIVHYGMDFIKDNVAQIEFFVARTSDDPEAEPVPVDLDDPAALELERISAGPYGGVSDLIAQHVVHNEAAGEGYLSVRYERDGIPIAPPEADSDDPFAEPPEDVTEVWEVLTPQTRKRRENDPKMRPVQSVRIWRPDPERPEWPDSSLRSVLTECEQLLLIQQHVSGVLQSRLHSGVMVVPDELDPSQAGPPDEGDDEMSPLMRDMFEVFSSPIKDPDAAAAIMPYLLFGKAELLKEVRHLTISREFDAYILELAEHVKFAIAGGLDLPAERLLGMGGSNHWNVWYLDESTYVQHLRPDVDLVVDGLLRAWLRPAWAAAGLDPDAYTVIADPQKLTMMSVAGQPGDIPTEELERRATTAGILIRAGFDAEAVLEVVGLPEMPHVGFLPTTIAERPAPDLESALREMGLTAAATVEELGTMLADIDDRVLSDLLALAEEAIATEAADAEERLAEAMAAAGISADTPDLAQALEDADISPETVVPDDAFDQISDEAQSIMDAGLDQARATVERVADTSIDFDAAADVAAGATFLTVAMTDWLRSRWFNPRPGGDDGLARFARGADIEGQPVALVREALTTAGGGRGATPGSVGLANGQTVEGWLIQAGLATRAYRWRYGSPPESFPPHRRLAGVIFDGPDDERIANTSNRWPHNFHWYPMDHSGCRCRWERVLVPVETVP